MLSLCLTPSVLQLSRKATFLILRRRMSAVSHPSNMTYVQLFLDWDGTLTKRDTILTLSRIGYKANEQHGLILPSWEGIVAAYLADLKTHARSYKPAKEQRRTVKEETEYLASLKAVERASTNRVVEAGVFRNVNAEDLEIGAKQALESREVEMRPGWENLFKLKSTFDAKRQNDVDVSIVTVNWSESFIRSCLLQSASKQDIDPMSIKDIRIYGNEVEGVYKTRRNNTLGNLVAGNAIHTTTDKAATMAGPISEGQKKAFAAGQRYVSVYVGDTCTDFCPLLNADVGICVRDAPLNSGQNELAETLERVGVTVMPLEEADRRQFGQGGPSKVVYWTSHLAEVATFVDAKLLSP